MIIRHLIFRVIAQKGHNFDNYPYSEPQKVGTWIYDDSCRDFVMLYLRASGHSCSEYPTTAASAAAYMIDISLVIP